MTERPRFDFGGGDVAERYDAVMVPVLFDPWADLLLETLPPEPDWDVLDLAAGTGVVAGKLATRLGRGGSLTAADISADMLAIAQRRVEASAADTAARFVEGPAHPLALDDVSFDAIYCQQGFQFFPDGGAAAAEMHRVARPGAAVAVSAWCPLSECGIFEMIAECLLAIGEDEAAAAMGVPFDHMPARRFESLFASAGFGSLSIERVERDLVLERGLGHVRRFLYATPLAPRLAAFEERKRSEFETRLLAAAEECTRGGVTRTPMASLVLTARR